MLVTSLWGYSLFMWKRHNEAVSRTAKVYSDRNRQCMRECVTEVYQHLREIVSTEDEWLFREEVQKRIEQSISQLIGWLERMLVCFESGPFDENPIVIRAR